MHGKRFKLFGHFLRSEWCIVKSSSLHLQYRRTLKREPIDRNTDELIERQTEQCKVKELNYDDTFFLD